MLVPHARGSRGTNCPSPAVPCLLQCCFSPDEKFVLTGTSAEGKDSNGSVVVLSADSLERLGEMGVDGSAVAVQVQMCPGGFLQLGLHGGPQHKTVATAPLLAAHAVLTAIYLCPWF